MYQHRRKPTAKLKIGQQFEATVRDLASDGRGVVAHPDGRIFFVPGVWAHERARFEITELKGRTGSAQLRELLESSPDRVPSPCPYHGFDDSHCGGCSWMFMRYAQQLAAKQQRVQRAVEKLFTGCNTAPILASPKELGYRNRAQLKTDGNHLGYIASGSHTLVDISECVVLNDRNQKTLDALRRQLPAMQWKPKRAHWTSLHIDDDICGEINTSTVPINTRRPFRQGNSEQNAIMRDWVRKKLTPTTPNTSILELFAGSGNFTEVLHSVGWSHIFAVDSFQPAIEVLKDREFGSVETHCINLDSATIAAQLSSDMTDVEALLLDPPRQGMKYLDQILDFAPRIKTIAYISCDVATFARDCATLRDANFSPELIQPLDLFPQTPHVEVMSLFNKGSV